MLLIRSGFWVLLQVRILLSTAEKRESRRPRQKFLVKTGGQIEEDIFGVEADVTSWKKITLDNWPIF